MQAVMRRGRAVALSRRAALSAANFSPFSPYPLRRYASSLAHDQHPYLSALGISTRNAGVWTGKGWKQGSGATLSSVDPHSERTIAHISAASREDYDVSSACAAQQHHSSSAGTPAQPPHRACRLLCPLHLQSCMAAMDGAKVGWQRTPMPVRGGLLRALASALTAKLDPLSRLITLETGKILSEGRGEVQEAIDICHHAAGLSRCIDGSLLPSERREHLMMERWLPLRGHVGVISAFNFPLAVFFWNFALSLLMGNTTVWKPSETTTLTAIAACNIISATLQQEGHDGALFTLCSGSGADVGQAMAEDGRLELLSFTGSTRAGKDVAVRVAQRLGKSLLELGGNNAMIVMPDADLDLALRAVLFAAVGTAGQRCTSLRRLYLHADIYDSFLSSLVTAYASVRVGDPFHSSTLCGPLHSARAVSEFVAAVQRVEAEGGRIVAGGQRVDGPGYYVQPTIAAMPADAPMLQHELFAPVLSVVRVDSLSEGIALHNGVKQGLSSSLFSRDVGNIMRWLGSEGSDCGLVNVNLGTSGAEIGGAFGGEKDTGGGRESGSDAWKAYGRRITAVVNYGKELPLAQGVSFL